MSLQISYSVKFSGDCANIILENTTGDYNPSNVTGYGGPNTGRSDILTAKAVIILPDSTVVDNLVLTLPTINPTITVISKSTLGIQSLPEGIYQISITETSSTNIYTKVINTLNYCSTQCCLDKLISTLDISDCNCSTESLMQVNKMEYYLRAASDAASCNKSTKATKLLKAAQDLCSQKKCDCNS